MDVREYLICDIKMLQPDIQTLLRTHPSILRPCRRRKIKGEEEEFNPGKDKPAGSIYFMGCIELVTLGSQPMVHGLGLVPGWSAASGRSLGGEDIGDHPPRHQVMFVVSGSAQCKAPERDACKKSRDEVEVEVEVGKGWEAEKPRGVAQKGASTSRGSSRDHERPGLTRTGILKLRSQPLSFSEALRTVD
ncbi:hypothetical protein TESG_02641 [Trichophyton tonsurans CBS 112818]|uniref:Uncharacterized protein n=1 Tax=Trichophyton tonsurans (strain CBS 112818) TaxID=647933 RepID=F2RUT4_TRIT1|nr:hypothetical protein TESG_02641 [Trichophyton tonsurans CBS 112818]